jgi:hypothetical protein
MPTNCSLRRKKNRGSVCDSLQNIVDTLLPLANMMYLTDIQNHQFSITFDGRSCFSPGANSARRVLDVGTGTGVWAIDFGMHDQHTLPAVV